MAIENFTTYTEVDPSSDLTVTASKIDVSTMDRDIDAYVYKDKGANHFSGDFEHLMDFKITSVHAQAIYYLWGVSTGIGGIQTQIVADEDLLALAVGNLTGYAYEVVAGVLYYSSGYTYTIDTAYYLAIERDESVGTHGTEYIYTYSDSARTNLLATQSVTLKAKNDFRYIYGISSHNSGDSGMTVTCYTQNLDLQEAVAATRRRAAFMKFF